MTQAPKAETGVPQAPQKPQQKPQPQIGKAKPDKNRKPVVEPSEPEMVAIPLEEMEQQPQAQKKTNRS